MDSEGNSKDWFALINLTRVFTEFLHYATQGNEYIQCWLWLLITYLAMGLPGEIRFLNNTDWQFHHALGILNIWWS